LLMISMVKSVDRVTKLLCVMGLNNLLDTTTIKITLNEGFDVNISSFYKSLDLSLFL